MYMNTQMFNISCIGMLYRYPIYLNGMSCTNRFISELRDIYANTHTPFLHISVVQW